MRRRFAAVVLGVVLLVAGVGHFADPDAYRAFFPPFVAASVVVFLIYATGALELALGMGLLIPDLRRYAALGSVGLMVLFWPVHVRDLFIQSPAIGSRALALVRAPLQAVFVVWSYWVARSPAIPYAKDD